MSIVSLNNSTNPLASTASVAGQSVTGSSLTGQSTSGQKPALEMAAEQFEAMFLQQVLKQMRKAGDVLAADNPLRSREMDTMRDFYDGVLAETLAGKRQTGIANMLVKQLSGGASSSPSAATQSVTEASAQAQSAPVPERRSVAMDNSVNLASLRSQWQRGLEQGFERGIDGLENIWNKSSAGFKALVNSVIRQESGGKVDAVSSKGALGVMQLMPDTARQMARELGVQFNLDRLTRDADYNTQLGTAFLSRMLERYDGEPALALAAYNAGPARVDEWLERHGDPRIGQISMSSWVRQIPFKETRDYTSRILSELTQSGSGNSMQIPVSAGENSFKRGLNPVALNEVTAAYRPSAEAQPWRSYTFGETLGE